MRVHAFISKSPKQRKSHASSCTPRNQPVANWKPKHPELTQSALELMRAGVGIKTAPFQTQFRHKFFASEVAQQLAGPAIGDERSATATHSITVATLTARVIEAANAMKSAEPQRYGDAELLKQSYKDDPGWCKTTTRGSGVAMNDAGKHLFELALTSLPPLL